MLDRAATLHRDAVVWEQHTCLPLHAGADVGPLMRYVAAGVDLVSVNVGFDLTPLVDTMKVLASFRRQVGADPRLELVDTVVDVLAAKRAGRLAVTFDIEGTEPLGGEAALVEAYHALGVRTMAIVFNQRNRAGGGCHGDPGDGLSAFGREVVREMNRVGMLVDATHCSLRTSMDLFEASTAPVVFSHSNPRALCDHERNITDDQIRACAEVDGVVGINGLGIFLGGNDTRTERIVDAIAYVADLVGVEHVGIALDYVFDQEELQTYLTENRDTYPPGSGYGDFERIEFVEPERFPAITRALLERGFDEDAVRAVLGGNFLRVAGATWKPAGAPSL